MEMQVSPCLSVPAPGMLFGPFSGLKNGCASCSRTLWTTAMHNVFHYLNMKGAKGFSLPVLLIRTALQRWEDSIYGLPMRNSTNEHHEGEGPKEAVLHLALDGLLPANQVLAVNPSMRTATLFASTVDEEAHIIAQQHFSPNGMHVLIPLLETYPHYYPYKILLTNLFSHTPNEAREQLQDH